MALSAENLIYGRMGEPLAAPLTLNLRAGEALCLRGANGSGKSTLLRVLAGLVPPLGGTLRQCDSVIYLGHQSPLNGELTVGAHLIQMADLHGISRDTVAPIMSRLGLAPHGDWALKTLSAGQRRRVALATVVGSGKRCWLLDEPTTGLDDIHRALFDTLVSTHIQDGGAVLFTSHHPHDIENLRVLELGS